MTLRDEFFKYPFLDRTQVVIKHKDAFYDWVKAECDFEWKRREGDDSTIYLLEGTDYPDQYEKILKERYKQIFGRELHSFMRDDDKWPKDMSWEKFNEFFEYSIISGAIDLEPDMELLDEEFFEDPPKHIVAQLHLPVLKGSMKNITDFLYEEQANLFQNNTGETSVAHQIAIELGEYLGKYGYDVDMEYTGMTKEESESIKKSLNLNSGNTDKAIYPDIIVHKRGNNGNNLLAVEIRIEGHGRPADREYDMKKLEAYCKEMGYGYGVFLEFGADGIVEEIWVKKGKRV